MKKTNHKHILGRYMFISLFIFLLAGAVLVKLFRTTVLDARLWNETAQRELRSTKEILPERGNILAADGSVLATTLQYFTVRIDYRAERFKVDSLRKYAGEIADSMCVAFPGRATASQWKDSLLSQLDKPFKDRKRSFRLIDNISDLDVRRLKKFPFFNMGAPGKTGLVVENKYVRRRPYGEMARRSIGGVGQTKESRQIHGISGLECALDSFLYGVPGRSKKVMLTRRLVDLADKDASRGYDVVTTIDIGMQDIVENELNTILETCKADWGVAVLMEVATGDIKAISNLERSKSGDSYIEGMNRAVLGFEPGSVMKPISMMIALEKGLVNNINSVINTGFSYAYAGGRPITDSHGCGSMTVAEVIERSSNIGMTKVITGNNSIFHRDPAKFREALKEIGFFDRMNTGIAGERTPIIEAKPSRIALSRMCYGYATLIPPLYTLAVYNAIANNGKFVRPRLYSELRHEVNGDTVINVSYIRDSICSPENAAKMREMLTRVVAGDHGTGRRLRNPYVTIAGKTGTCYMVDPKTHQYNTGTKRLAFCGFFPAENPKYSCIVLTCRPRENLMGAASTSGQVLKNIAVKMYSRGMLDNSSDFRAGCEGQVASPHVFNTSNKEAGKGLSTLAGLRISQGENAEKISRGVVPSVTGMGLREAVVRLEQAGFNVRVHGRGGYVARQSKAAGEKMSPGKTIELTLA